MELIIKLSLLQVFNFVISLGKVTTTKIKKFVNDFMVMLLIICGTMNLTGCAFVRHNYEPETIQNNSNTEIKTAMLTVTNTETNTKINSITKTTETNTEENTKPKYVFERLQVGHSFSVGGYTVYYGNYARIGNNDSGDKFYLPESIEGQIVEPGIFSRAATSIMLTEDNEICIVDDRLLTHCDEITEQPIAISKIVL